MCMGVAMMVWNYLVIYFGLCLPLLSVKHLVVKWARGLLANVFTTLLCRLVQWLFICLFVQHDSRCRQLSLCVSGHRLHRGEMFCLRKAFLGQFPKYRPYHNSRICVIYAVLIHGVRPLYVQVSIRWPFVDIGNSVVA